ncbi:hypothetical protein AKJ16_DCAP08127 [Drosera capensis]
MPVQWVVHQTLNLKILMNLIPSSFPIDTTCLELASSDSNPTKLPVVITLPSDETRMFEAGVAMMLAGTSVRNGWESAKSVEPSRVMVEGEVSRATLVMLGAICSSRNENFERGIDRP